MRQRNFLFNFLILFIAIVYFSSCDETVNEFDCETLQVTFELDSTTVDSTLALTAIPSGGEEPYVFSWSTGEDTNSVDYENGQLTVTVTDANGCEKSNTYGEDVVTPNCDNFSSSISYVDTFGVYSLQAIGSGGTLPYTFLWSTGENTSGISADENTSYKVTVTDSNDCTSESTYEVTLDSCGLQVTINIDSTSGNQILSISLMGGTPPYSYLWSTGAVSQTIQADHGEFTITVTDSKGCVETNSIILASENPCDNFMVNVYVLDSLNVNDIHLYSNVSGGEPSYTYSWSNGDVTQGITLPGGTKGKFGLTVTESNGCTTSDEIELE